MAISLVAGTVATVFRALQVGAWSSHQYNSGATGSDRCLIVSVVHENGIAGPTGINYNGAALTKIAEQAAEPGRAYSETGSVWYLVSPATGENTLELVGASGNQDGIVMAAVYSGVSQSGTIGNTATLKGTTYSTGSNTTIEKAESSAVVWLLHKDRSRFTDFVVEPNNTIRLREQTVGTVDVDTGTGGSAGAIGDRTDGSGAVSVGVETSDGARGIIAAELLAQTEGPPVVAPSNAPAIDSASITANITTVSGTFTFDEAANTEDPATAYEVRVDGGAWQQTEDPAVLSFTVYGLTPNTPYNTPGVEVRALNSGGPGPVSTAVPFTTEAILATPVNLSSTNIQADRVRFNWERG